MIVALEGIYQVGLQLLDPGTMLVTLQRVAITSELLKGSIVLGWY